MKIRYFAWVRERTGRTEEDVELPSHVSTVSELMAWLKSRGPEYEAAFEHPRFIRAALDQNHVKHEASLSGVREVAFFPPMTGG